MEKQRYLTNQLDDLAAGRLTAEQVLDELNGQFSKGDINYALKYYSPARGQWEALQELRAAWSLRQSPAAPVAPTQPTPAHRFTCRECGEHRDTTRRGHCDDCEA